MGVLATPTWALQPAAEQMTLSTNYITSFNFLSQYLPDTYEKEFERYGNRTVSSFLRMVGAELPSNSDQIIWAEQGRLHLTFKNCQTTNVAGATTASVTFTVPQSGNSGGAGGVQQTLPLRVGQTIFIQDTTGASNKAIINSVTQGGVNNLGSIGVYFYEPAQNVAANTNCVIFVYGSEFKKGTAGMVGSLDSEDVIYTNKPIILKDTYQVNGSDMAQVGWVEVTSENGATGYLWYLKSEHETRLRFEDYMETSLIEAKFADNTGTGAGGGAATNSGAYAQGYYGSEGVFSAVSSRGNVWGAGLPANLSEWDTIVSRLDKQGAIEENAIFCSRDLSFAVDNMLATLNGYTSAGVAQSASFGLFDNDVTMALNLGFTGFRRGYDFYKSDWKYLNDPTMRGSQITPANVATNGVGTVNGLMVPAGSTSVYDQVLGKNAKRPFLHVRYRASEAEDRRYKTWITGSAGGAATVSDDYMQVNFLSERCVCVLGANNFFLFRYGA